MKTASAGWERVQKRWVMNTELQLVRRAKQGDAEAFAELYRNIYQNLYRFALYTLNEPADAEDAVGDAVADAWMTIGKLRADEAFRGWMFRILSNKCKRKRKEYVGRPLAWNEEIGEKPGEDKLAENYVLRSAFGELEKEDRMIISMHVFGGYTSREISEITGMNANTVRSRESRALKKLAGKLEESEVFS